MSVAPLVSLDAVILDTETTGPDAANARLIQIGAVRYAKGRILPDRTLQILVDPGEPIPESSTRIHGICDGDVAGAPKFSDAYRTLSEFAGDAIIIGHSIGFDLAVLSDTTDPAVWQAELDAAHRLRREPGFGAGQRGRMQGGGGHHGASVITAAPFVNRRSDSGAAPRHCP